MTVNLTMLTYGRQRLTEQAMKSLVRNTEEIHPLTSLSMAGGSGQSRNAIIRLAEKSGRKDLLYLSDNDVFFTPRWLETLLEAWDFARDQGFKILSAYCHPYNAQPVREWPLYVNGHTASVVENLAVATQSWLLEWETWDKYGPFAETPGVRQSEDVEFCNKVRADGGKVGYLKPFVVWNTSKTDTFGELVPGHELIEAPEGIIVE